MQYHWTLTPEDREILSLLESKLCTPAHPSFFERHGHKTPSQADVVCRFLTKNDAAFTSTSDHVTIVLDDAERAELLHEMNGLLKRMEHESNNLAYVPTSSNPEADFWDLLANTQTLLTELTALEPVP